MLGDEATAPLVIEQDRLAWSYGDQFEGDREGDTQRLTDLLAAAAQERVGVKGLDREAFDVGGVTAQRSHTLREMVGHVRCVSGHR